MTLVSNFIMAKVNGGQTIGLHGAHGIIHRSTVQGSRFRRPVSKSAGYQRLGSDVKESIIDFWHACGSALTADIIIDSLNSFSYQAAYVTHAQDSGLRCIITGIEFTLSRACRGPLISGSTFATWRLEGRITLEYAP